MAAKHCLNSLASSARVLSCHVHSIGIAFSAAKNWWVRDHAGNLTLRISINKLTWREMKLPQTISNSESPELSDPESVADSKGEGNCASHKIEGKLGMSYEGEGNSVTHRKGRKN